MPSLQPWYWRSLPLSGRSGRDVFDCLFLRPLVADHLSSALSFKPQPTDWIATLLESPVAESKRAERNGIISLPYDSHPQTRYSICAGKPRLTKGSPHLRTPPIGQVFKTLKHLLAPDSTGRSVYAGLPAELPLDFPFTGGWLGWLGYDVAWEVERLPWLRSDPLPFPVAYWYEPESFAVLDHDRQQLWLAASHPLQLDLLHQTLEVPPRFTALGKELISIQPAFYCTDQGEYEAAVLKALEYIRAGDIFQANLSLRFSTQGTLDSWRLYQTLQRINPSPFSSYWQTPWGAMVSCSPERLVKLQWRQAQTRPIAGTRSRGSTRSQDQHLAQELLGNAKEKAEHIMLVDLERNDLGRICEAGSVNVDEFLVLEYYSHVMHLVSNITGTLKAEADAIDLIRAIFPGGTITGCPKVRCMEIIEELEPVRRSLFYGSCGYLDQRGQLDLNILIRTLLLTPRQREPLRAYFPSPVKVWGQVGAGIVADSDPTLEWHESLHKAQAQLTALHQQLAQQE
jgi:para-aminobenzoate synthetase component I